jgi:DegV family protein with EDD domain
MSKEFIPFAQERVMSKWENVVDYNLGDSGVHPMTTEELVDDPILVIHVGSEFSHTFKTTELAKAMLPGINIHLIDSHSNALGLGFQVLAVARAAQRGKGIKDLIAIADQARATTGVVFLVKDVKYIHHGGRINLGQRIIASSLNLVPIMEICNGPVELIHIARSNKKAMGKMVDVVKHRLADGSPIRVGVHHVDNEQEDYELRKAVEDLLNPDEFILEQLNPILGIHTGPGAISLAYCFRV